MLGRAWRAPGWLGGTRSTALFRGGPGLTRGLCTLSREGAAQMAVTREGGLGESGPRSPPACRFLMSGRYSLLQVLLGAAFPGQPLQPMTTPSPCCDPSASAATPGEPQPPAGRCRGWLKLSGAAVERPLGVQASTGGQQGCDGHVSKPGLDLSASEREGGWTRDVYCSETAADLNTWTELNRRRSNRAVPGLCFWQPRFC